MSKYRKITKEELINLINNKNNEVQLMCSGTNVVSYEDLLSEFNYYADNGIYCYTITVRTYEENSIDDMNYDEFLDEIKAVFMCQDYIDYEEVAEEIATVGFEIIEKHNLHRAKEKIQINKQNYDISNLFKD